MRLISLHFGFVAIGLAAALVLEDSNHWLELSKEELEEALSYKWKTHKARNVIVFIGDGMGTDTITASRMYRAGETSHLAWEKFPHIGILKTYNTNKQIPDSASTATALFGGVKTNYKVVGVDAHVPLGDCNASLNADYHVHSIITWAQAAGKDTGFVTTTRVTHATPAPLYAHSANRKWECEASMPKNATRCKDIARQLVENAPGRNIKVIMGGGRQVLKSNVTGTKADPVDTWACKSNDHRDLIKDWEKDKSSRKVSFRVVENNEQLAAVDVEKTDYLLGIFANSHISMDWKRDRGPKGQPSLEDMTKTALRILQKSPNGYVLVVEGGLIDFAHHRGHAAQALLETVRFSDAVNATLRMIDVNDTLVIVTSDHSHSLNINGYSDRGNSILGVAGKGKLDDIPYTTLSYSTGGPNNVAYTNKSGVFKRTDPTESNTTDFTYSQQALIITDEVTHGGGDVAVYAIGPLAHLFHSVHEQSYVARVIAYAADIGEYANSAVKLENSYQISISLFSSLFLLVLSYYRFP